MSTISSSTTSTTAYKVTADTTGTLVLQTGATPTTAVTIDGSQNVGVGVTPSAWGSDTRALQIYNRTSLSDLQSTTQLTNNGYWNGSGWVYRETATAGNYNINAGAHIWRTAPSGTAGNAITFTQAMTLTAAGSLLVGRTSPLTLWSGDERVVSIKSSGSDACGINVSSSNANNTTLEMFASYGNTNTGFVAKGDASYPEILFSQVNGSTYAERARIDANGTLLTYQPNNYPNLRLDATRSSSGSEEVMRIRYTVVSPNSSSQWFIYADDASTQRFSVRSNGGIANYQANDANLSDRREKTNFAPAGDYLAKICAIPVQTFNYIDQNFEEDDGLTLGVVAQDVQAVAPELVAEGNWASKDEEPKMRLSIYQTDLQYALMKCIQEQQALITQLQADVAQLKGKA